MVCAMSVAAARSLWCTTCGEYVRPGTHGIHPMHYGTGADRAEDFEPDMSGAAAVALVALAIGGTGAALIAAAMLIVSKC
jgi:hypothetical protein